MRESLVTRHPLHARIGTRLDAAPLLVMLDVDGTLAPIAPRPEQAAIPLATLDVLHRIASLPAVILAFVSGRAAADTWRMTGVTGAWVAGNHGAELRAPDGAVTVHPGVRAFEGAVDKAAKALRADLAMVAGASVENKRWTLSVHYRLVADADAPALISRAETVASAHGLRLMDGKKIVELRPPVEVNKGTAIGELLQRAGVNASVGSALYCGDDRTDEDAFRALRREVSDAVTIRIAPGSPIQTAAEFELDTPEELRKMLEWLAERRAGKPVPR